MSSSVGPEALCHLEAGTYQTKFLRPQLTYTVPKAGWGSVNREASPGNFHLFAPGGSMDGFQNGTTDDITFLSAVAPPGPCTGEPSSTVPSTFDGLVRFLQANPHLKVANVRDVTVAGLAGTSMDLALVASDGCPDGEFADLMIGVDPSHGAFSIAPAMAGVRLFLLHLPASDKAYAVLFDDAKGIGEYGDGDAWYGVAQGVLDSLVITP